jgi:thiamine-phosphate pyrophosphorylase
MIDPTALRLIAITDDLRDGVAGLTGRAAAAVRGGATMVQVRLKLSDARSMLEVARSLIAALPVPVIINDRVDVALAAGAAGVHLGADDMPASAARRIVPPGFTIGVSVGGDEEVAGAACADYVGIGPLFATSSKADAGAVIGVAEFSRLANAVGVPSVAIGGIAPETVSQLRGAGAAGVAVIRAVMSAVDPERAARAIRDAM